MKIYFATHMLGTKEKDYYFVVLFNDKFIRLYSSIQVAESKNSRFSVNQHPGS